MKLFCASGMMTDVVKSKADSLVYFVYGFHFQFAEMQECYMQNAPKGIAVSLISYRENKHFLATMVPHLYAKE